MTLKVSPIRIQVSDSMSVGYFLYGLISFSMGIVVALRGRRNSQIALGHQFYWLSAFGFFSSVYAWGRMFQTFTPMSPLVHDVTSLLISFSLAIAGVVLVRFGIGLIVDAGPIPNWIHLLPVVLIVPAMLLVAYAIIIVSSAADLETAAIQWSRTLLLFPGSLLAALGFARQWWRLHQAGSTAAPGVLLMAATAWIINAVLIGDMAETLGLSSQTILSLTGQPMEFWRLTAMSAVSLLVMRSMGVFEVEREQEMHRLNAARHEAQRMALTIHAKSRQESELWLNAFVNISRRVANLDDADAVLTDVVTLACSLVSADSAGIALFEADGQLRTRVQATSQGGGLIQDTGVVNPLIRRAAQNCTPLRFPEDAPNSAFYWGTNGASQQATAAAILPLQLNHTPIGALWVVRTKDASFTCGDLIGLGNLGNLVVIALEHTSMASRLQSLAVIEERSRIAREMHDSLAQILGYLGLEMQTLEALARQHDEEALIAELKSARVAIKSAQADVRENILSLRTTLAGDVQLSDALAAYVEEFGIQTAIQAETVNRTGSTPALSPLAETQCVRIIQEALTNVRKHASARSVCVEMATQDGWFEVMVADDGVGLPQKPASNRHFGLHTMRERAESVGGSLTIISPPGRGTTVTLRLPLLS